MEFVSNSGGDLSAWLVLTFFEVIPFLLLRLNACKMLIITSLFPHSSLLTRKTDFINELCTYECGFGFQSCPKYFLVILDEESIIYPLVKWQFLFLSWTNLGRTNPLLYVRISEMALTRISKI